MTRVSQQCGRLCDVVSQRAARVPAADARQRIVAATERLLRDRRFRDLTVEDVMAEAGLARTVFYRHFDGLPAVVIGLLDDLLAAIVALADDAPGDRETLRRQLALAVRTFREHGPLLLALDEAAPVRRRVEAAYRAWIDHTVDVSAELIQRGVERGHTPPLPVRGRRPGAHRDERHLPAGPRRARPRVRRGGRARRALDRLVADDLAGYLSLNALMRSSYCDVSRE